MTSARSPARSTTRTSAGAWRARNSGDPLRGVPVREALDSAVVALSAAGVDTPRLDAEVLLAHALGVDRTALVIDRDRPVEGPAVRAFQDAVRRRSVAREPVAYITGTKGSATSTSRSTAAC